MKKSNENSKSFSIKMTWNSQTLIMKLLKYGDRVDKISHTSNENSKVSKHDKLENQTDRK